MSVFQNYRPLKFSLQACKTHKNSNLKIVKKIEAEKNFKSTNIKILKLA